MRHLVALDNEVIPKCEGPLRGPVVSLQPEQCHQFTPERCERGSHPVSQNLACPPWMPVEGISLSPGPALGMASLASALAPVVCICSGNSICCTWGFPRCSDIFFSLLHM